MDSWPPDCRALEKTRGNAPGSTVHSSLGERIGWAAPWESLLRWQLRLVPGRAALLPAARRVAPQTEAQLGGKQPRLLKLYSRSVLVPEAKGQNGDPLKHPLVALS